MNEETVKPDKFRNTGSGFRVNITDLERRLAALCGGRHKSLISKLFIRLDRLQKTYARLESKLKGETSTEELVFAINSLEDAKCEEARLKLAFDVLIAAYLPEEDAGLAVNRQPIEQKLYLMLNRRNGYTKIGKSKDPKYREQTLQAEDPDIELLVAVPQDAYTEDKLHQRFADKRLRGEWFDLSEDERESLITELSTLTGHG